MERRRSTLRTAVVWSSLESVLTARSHARGRPLRVIDLGGGTGGLAVRVAQLGHHVTVVDPSPDALASLERRAAESGVAVVAVLGDADTLLDAVEPAQGDVVLCHGVLEVVDKPARALEQLASALAPGGVVSLLAAQKSGAVLGRALAGHLADARAVLDSAEGRDSRSETTGRRFTQAELGELLVEAGFDVVEVRGVRVFSDHVSSAMVDSDPAAADELRALEAEVSTLPEFMAMATQLHLLATHSG